HEIPGRIHEGVHGVGFAASGRAALRAATREESLVLGQGVAAAVRNEVFRQDHRQVGLGDRDGTAVGAMDDGDRRTPVTLPGNSPIAQAPCGLLLAQAHVDQVGGDRVNRLGGRQAVVFARVYGPPSLFVGVPILPAVGGVGLALDCDDLLDR